MPMFKCIIFDCDGTLVDSEVLFNRALSIKLQERGIDLSAEQLVKRFRGVQLTTVLSIIQSESNVELDSAFIDDYRDLVNHFFQDQLKECNGVSQTLDEISIAKCVATNGPLAKMRLALKVTHLDSYFNENLFSAYEVGAWKPDPSLFLFAAKKMGFKPDECLVVEDSIVGINAAKAAQMQSVLYDPNHVHGEVNTTKIHHFTDLLEQLD